MKKITYILIFLTLFVAFPIWATLTDLGSGLIDDSTTNLVWEQSAGPRKNWSGATTYCSELDIVGYDAWRLPTRSELSGLVESDYSPRIDPIFDIDPSGGATYWTSEEVTDQDILNRYVSSLRTRSYAVYFINGATIHDPQRSHNRIRCVHAAYDHLLLESGGKLLLESGGYLLLE